MGTTLSKTTAPRIHASLIAIQQPSSHLHVRSLIPAIGYSSRSSPIVCRNGRVVDKAACNQSCLS